MCDCILTHTWAVVNDFAGWSDTGGNMIGK